MINSWKDITVKQYKEIAKIKQDDDWIWKVIAITKGMTLQEVLSAPINESTCWAAEIINFAKKPVHKHMVRTSYVIGETTYHLCLRPEEITTAQYIDFYQLPKILPAQLDSLLSIFLIPEGKKYNEDYSVEQVKQEINEHLDIETALSLMDFFRLASLVLRRRIIARLKRDLRRLKRGKKTAEKAEAAQKALDELLRLSGLK